MTIQAAELAKNVLNRNEAILLPAVEGLTAEELRWQPGPDSNPIGWLMWHLSRVQDNHVSAMAHDKAHIWTTDGWDATFSQAGQLDRGRGHTSEQVQGFQPPDAETLTAYYRAVRAETDKFLDDLTETDLERPVPALQGDGTLPLHERLEMVLVDGVQHSGQIAYLRGLLKGKGWFAS